VVPSPSFRAFFFSLVKHSSSAKRRQTSPNITRTSSKVTPLPKVTCTTFGQEVFLRLPLPSYVDEEFKIDITWKDAEKKMEPPPYTHIRRSILLCC
uniref:Uncharacterized protein n=1 Tax=Cucumis melo TaxID=3656 RepID=A0A9I9E2C2_CUCME